MLIDHQPPFVEEKHNQEKIARLCNIEDIIFDVLVIWVIFMLIVTQRRAIALRVEIK